MLYEAIACVPRTQGSEFVLAEQKSVSCKKERQLNQRPDMLTEVRMKCQTNKTSLGCAGRNVSPRRFCRARSKKDSYKLVLIQGCVFAFMPPKPDEIWPRGTRKMELVSDPGSLQY